MGPNNLQHQWTVSSADENGENALGKVKTMTFDGDTMTLTKKDGSQMAYKYGVVGGKYMLPPAVNTGQPRDAFDIDLTPVNGEGVLRGVFCFPSLEDSELGICWNIKPGGERPKDIMGGKGYFTYRAYQNDK